MEGEIVGGSIESVGHYDVEFKGGKLMAKIDAEKSGVSGGAYVAIDADIVLDALAKAIPGTLDDAIIGIAKAALKK